jgi:serine/threonine-protein kinase
MGDVYLAEDTRLGRKVALKVLPAAMTGSAESQARFLREAQLASALDHPNICTIHEIGEDSGYHFIAMQFVEGETLKRVIDGRPLDLSLTLSIGLQVADALASAHSRGIIHRDIKSNNIIITPRGQAKVLDFGLAKSLERAGRVGAGATGTELTRTGAMMGTPAYMSPEQARGEPVDRRGDIFSFGAVLYEMATGRLPFKEPSEAETMSAIINKPHTTAIELNRELPTALSRAIDRAMAKRPADRYQSINEMVKDLRACAAGIISTSSPDGAVVPYVTPRRRATFHRLKRRRVLLAAVAAAVLLISVAAFYLLRPKQAPPPVASAQIRSIAVLPFRSLNREARDDYLGLGIASDIITRISQSGELTVRPTSAVRKYLDREIDALEAAREMNVDSVLDGTFLHVGDQLRVSVNLLRVGDGASLWAEKFDEPFTDIFAIQDKVSQQVAHRLRLRLGPAEQARLNKRYPSNIEAYNYYAKAMYHFANIGAELKTRAEADLAVDLFKKAIDLDGKYALAHAYLGYAYIRIAVFLEESPALIEQAKEELAIAESLDPQLAEVHVARYFIAFSQYEGWQVETAIRELRLAQQLDPNAGHLELGDLYFHIGLEERAEEEMERALNADPNSDQIKNAYVYMYFATARPDEGLEKRQRLSTRGPDLIYYLEKRMVKEAAPLVEEEYQDKPGPAGARAERALPMSRPLFLALQGKHSEAQALALSILEKSRRNRGYHHQTYITARIYALAGKSEEALKWLRVTVREGFPCYPLFARDSLLDPVRKAPAFIQFLGEMKTRWEGFQREFG